VKKIVIIGGGLAGLVTSVKLVDAGSHTLFIASVENMSQMKLHHS
jgi:uncharacterized protein with NAD-binding domain and iron-sulfur cluster